MPVPCLPGLLDLPWLLHHAALRGVHRVAATERAHDSELRPGEPNCRALRVNCELQTARAEIAVESQIGGVVLRRLTV